MMVCLNLKFSQGEGGPSVTLNKTDLMNIFIPQGDLIGQTNFATLRASMNITNLFIESREVCTITALMQESLGKILKNNHSLSSSNRKIITILRKTLKNLCQEDLESLQQLIETFSLNDLPTETKKWFEAMKSVSSLSREKRQLLVAAVVGIVTSLTTLFTTKELYSMSTASEDSLIDDTNHIISAITHQETKIERMDEQQHQLKQHLDRLTDQLILNSKTEDIFFDLFAAVQYAERLNQHVNRIQEAILSLVRTNKISPNLVKWTSIHNAIAKLREKAVNQGNELLLRSPSDIFQFHTDWVCLSTGQLTILTHIPLINPATKMKLYKYLPTPLADISNGKTHLMLNSDEHYLAVNGDGTIYATLTEEQLTHNCLVIDDTRVCKNLNILRKTNSPSCLYSLMMADQQTAKELCQFTIVEAQPFAARISPSKIYFFSPEPVILYTKCNEDSKTSSEPLRANGSTIINIGEGCKVHSKTYVFTRSKENLQETIEPIFNAPLDTDIWSFLKNPGAKSQDLEKFLKEEIKLRGKFSVSSFEAKFGLKHLSHKTAATRDIFASVTSVMILGISIIILWICRSNLRKLTSCQKKPTASARYTRQTGRASTAITLAEATSSLEDEELTWADQDENA